MIALTIVDARTAHHTLVVRRAGGGQHIGDGKVIDTTHARIVRVSIGNNDARARHEEIDAQKHAKLGDTVDIVLGARRRILQQRARLHRTPGGDVAPHTVGGTRAIQHAIARVRTRTTPATFETQ